MMPARGWTFLITISPLSTCIWYLRMLDKSRPKALIRSVTNMYHRRHAHRVVLFHIITCNTETNLQENACCTLLLEYFNNAESILTPLSCKSHLYDFSKWFLYRCNFLTLCRYMTGNPCTTYRGYRSWVICVLPGLEELDGTRVRRSERLRALQELSEANTTVMADQQQAMGKEVIKHPWYLCLVSCRAYSSLSTRAWCNYVCREASRGKGGWWTWRRKQRGRRGRWWKVSIEM